MPEASLNRIALDHSDTSSEYTFLFKVLCSVYLRIIRCTLGCSDDSDCSSSIPNCDVNDRECFYCHHDDHCSVHRNKICGSGGRCIKGGMPPIMDGEKKGS